MNLSVTDTSLKIATEQLFSNARLPLATEIKALYASYKEKSPEAVAPLHNAMTSALQKLQKEAEEERHHFAFHVKQAIQRFFPCLFHSSERKHSEKLEQIRALQTLVEAQYRSLQRIPTLSDEEQETVLHELCEIDLAGNLNTGSCSHERILEILRLLKDAQKLSLLDTVPKRSYSGWEERKYQSQLGRPHEIYTPLHYWAKEGNLQAVRHLLENGAHDYVQGSNAALHMRSATYFAALYGHTEVLTHLLQYGGRLDIAFDSSPYYFFVPQLVFDLVSIFTDDLIAIPPPKKCEEMLACLKIVLDELKRKNPASFTLQVKIPIKEDTNCVDFIDFCLGREVKASDIKAWAQLAHLKALLTQYGAVNGSVYSDAEMKEMANDTQGDNLYHQGILH